KTSSSAPATMHSPAMVKASLLFRLLPGGGWPGWSDQKGGGPAWSRIPDCQPCPGSTGGERGPWRPCLFDGLEAEGTKKPGCAEPTAAWVRTADLTGAPHRGQFACWRLGDSGKPHVAHFIWVYLPLFSIPERR